MSTDGTIRLPDGTLVPLLLGDTPPEPEPGVDVIGPDGSVVMTLPERPDVTFSYRDDQEIKAALHDGVERLREQLAEETASDCGGCAGRERPYVAPLREIDLRRVEGKSYEEVVAMLAEEDPVVVETCWRSFQKGAALGVALVAGVAVVWALLDRLVTSWG